MTEEEGDLLQAITNQYWRDFSELINSTLLVVPLHLRQVLEEKLQESSSVYGREDVHIYEKDAPHPYTLISWTMPSLHKTVQCKPSSRNRKLDLTKQLTFNHTATTPFPRFLSRNRAKTFLLTPSLNSIQCLAYGDGRWGEDSGLWRLIVSRQP